MAQLAGRQILIVDGYGTSACDLRAMFVRLGAHVHVVSSAAAALLLARRKKLDAALVEFALDHGTVTLCRELKAMRIPFVFTGALRRTDDDAPAEHVTQKTKAIDKPVRTTMPDASKVI